VNQSPTTASDFRKRYGIPNDRIVIVQVSWMIREKGIPELLQTAKVLLATNPNVHFVLVGEGAEREQFTKEAEALGIANHVTFTGLIQDPFGEGVFESADIVCQLSEWEELFGWMIAEAMAYGKPIVATNVGGIPELVDDGVTGFLVPRGDAATAAAKLAALAADPQLRRKLGDAGRKLVEEKFNLGRNVSQLVELYGLL
jgi:glycosyltransferase involved in cell wall biosynthesis